jgi:hypothetical protein
MHNILLAVLKTKSFINFQVNQAIDCTTVFKDPIKVFSLHIANCKFIAPQLSDIWYGDINYKIMLWRMSSIRLNYIATNGK